MTRQSIQIAARWRSFAQHATQTRSTHATPPSHAAATSNVHGQDMRAVNREEASDPELFHRTLTAQLREPGSRYVKRVLKRGWIPTNIRGRGKIDDMLIQMDPKPLVQDYRHEKFCYQKRPKYLLTGPLYELRVEEGAQDQYGNMMPTSHLQFERIRVLSQNVHIHVVKDVPIGLQLTYAPEDERVRIRIPIRCVNEEKSPGLRDGGWLNRLLWNVEVAVEPFVKPPAFAEVDVGELKMKQRLTIGDLVFAGKGEGCSTILPDDTPTTMVSKI